jgi:hypothetical protein
MRPTPSMMMAAGNLDRDTGAAAVYGWGSQVGVPYGMRPVAPTVNVDEFRRLQQDVAFLGQGYSQAVQKMTEMLAVMEEMRNSLAQNSSRQRSPSTGPERSTPSRSQPAKRKPKVKVSTYRS